MVTVQSMEFLVVYKIKRKQKKSRRQLTWTAERMWVDVIDTEQKKKHSCNVKNSI